MINPKEVMKYNYGIKVKGIGRFEKRGSYWWRKVVLTKTVRATTTGTVTLCCLEKLEAEVLK